MQDSEQYWVILPATGIGQRMQASRPKQYLPLKGKSILLHTLDKVLSHPQITGAVLVLNKHDQYWQKQNYCHSKPVLQCEGGERRHHSVLNGLLMLQQQMPAINPYVLIHDAVRPFVSHKDIDRLIDALSVCEDGALLAVPVADTLKYANHENRVQSTYPRENLWRAFTPQAFRLEKILAALKNVITHKLEVTDDVSAMELTGAQPLLVQGDSDNIKITTPQDLLLAKKIIG